MSNRPSHEDIRRLLDSPTLTPYVQRAVEKFNAWHTMPVVEHVPVAGTEAMHVGCEEGSQGFTIRLPREERQEREPEFPTSSTIQRARKWVREEGQKRSNIEVAAVVTLMLELLIHGRSWSLEPLGGPPLQRDFPGGPPGSDCDCTEFFGAIDRIDEAWAQQERAERDALVDAAYERLASGMASVQAATGPDDRGASVRHPSSATTPDREELDEWAARYVREHVVELRPVAEALAAEYAPDVLWQRYQDGQLASWGPPHREGYEYPSNRLRVAAAELLATDAGCKGMRPTLEQAQRVTFIHAAVVDWTLTETGLPLTDWSAGHGEGHEHSYDHAFWHYMEADGVIPGWPNCPEWYGLLRRSRLRLDPPAPLEQRALANRVYLDLPETAAALAAPYPALFDELRRFRERIAQPPTVDNAVPKPVAEAPPEQTKPKRRRREEWLAAAMLRVQDKPHESDAAVARAVEVSPSTLSRCPQYRRAAALARDKPLSGTFIGDADHALDPNRAYSRQTDEDEDLDERIDREMNAKRNAGRNAGARKPL